MEIRISSTATDACLRQIEKTLIDKYGCDVAAREMEPLRWYIDTGRASTDFLRRLYKAKPFMVGRKLHSGGSDRDVIDRVRKYIGKGDLDE